MEQIFRPLPFLRNPHLQTLLGTVLRRARTSLPAMFRKVPLPDGDAIALHDTMPRRWRHGGAIALLVHGLGGSFRSGYMIRVTDRLNQAGVRVLRMDLRGAGAGLRLARKLYHAGSSPDVRAVAKAIHNEFPQSPLYLAGFSLGGNIALKLAGEAAAEPVPNLHGVAAVAPPVDMIRCNQLLEAQPFYDRYFARMLKAHVRRHRCVFPDLPAVRFPPRLTLRNFDDAFTAPRNGFVNALDYYRRTQALPLLPSIQVPVLIVSARDDPFISVAPFEELPSGKNFDVRILPHGGHLGFLGWDGAWGIRWAECQVAKWITERTSQDR